MKTPESMKAELSAWNDGSGIDLESWIGCEGNFSLAIGYSTIFWPNFVEFEDYILIDGFSEESVRGFESQAGSTKKSVECVINHLHIADIQHYDCKDLTKDKIIHLGEVLKEIYQAKLAWNFPNKPCQVEFLHPDNPDDLIDYQLTFWQKKYG